MPKSLADAVTHLADVLERENLALTAMDVLQTAALLAEKTAASDALRAFIEVPARSEPALVPLARRLDRLARENRQLLERAIVAQQRVIGIVVDAAAAQASEAGYGGPAVRPAAMALSTRA